MSARRSRRSHALEQRPLRTRHEQEKVVGAHDDAWRQPRDERRQRAALGHGVLVHHVSPHLEDRVVAGDGIGGGGGGRGGVRSARLLLPSLLCRAPLVLLDQFDAVGPPPKLRSRRHPTCHGAARGAAESPARGASTQSLCCSSRANLGNQRQSEAIGQRQASAVQRELWV